MSSCLILFVLGGKHRISQTKLADFDHVCSIPSQPELRSTTLLPPCCIHTMLFYVSPLSSRHHECSCELVNSSIRNYDALVLILPPVSCTTMSSSNLTVHIHTVEHVLSIHTTTTAATLLATEIGGSNNLRNRWPQKRAKMTSLSVSTTISDNTILSPSRNYPQIE